MSTASDSAANRLRRTKKNRGGEVSATDEDSGSETARMGRLRQDCGKMTAARGLTAARRLRQEDCGKKSDGRANK